MPVGSLVNIETIAPYGGKAIYPPAAWGTYKPGLLVADLYGNTKARGYPSCDWPWHGSPGGVLYYGQARYLRAWICGTVGTLWSGEATVLTKTVNETAYERCNTIMTFPEFDTAQPNFKAFVRYSIHLGKLVSL